MGPELPMPGPGTYDVRDFKEPEKKYMSSAVFVSSTGRNIGTTGLKDIPGPANYNPSKLVKNSFHYNVDKKWLWKGKKRIKSLSICLSYSII